MKKLGNPKSFSKTIFSLAFSAIFAVGVSAQEPVATAAPAEAAAAPAAGSGDPVKGKELFNTNCAACHKLDAKMTGPALRGVGDKYDKEWLYKWIKNSSDLIKSGDAKAVKVYEEFAKANMTAFPQLSNGDIDNIVAYAMEPAPEPETPKAGVAEGSEKTGSGISNNLILGILAFILGALIFVLFSVNKLMRNLAKKEGVDVPEGKSPANAVVSFAKAYVKNQFIMVVTAILFLLISAYFMYGYFMQIGVDKGYEPIQPIHYSHKIHAGENGIDCKYCHSSARVSKNAGIPSLNVCMNCHKNISEFQGSKDSTYVEYTKEFYTAEIQKLYDAVGWDKATQKYTGKTKPVKWVRIHNLPDFVYFNHSQHVTVGGIECQKCHGKVESFEVMKQDQPLTMGWCINCHRETNVKVEDNGYYTKIHDQLAKKLGVTKLTAAQMGGLECGKCHY
jgi:mono/diheme cytochrome c family protein